MKLTKEPETVLCPLHGQPLELKVEDKKLIGVCRCDVPGNKHAGRRVYEQSIDNKEN